MQKELKISKQNLSAKITTKQKPTTKQLNIHQVSKIIGQFKSAIENHNNSKLISLSQYKPGRKQFVDQLLGQYKSITVKVFQLNLIPQENKAKTQIELTNLVDKNNVKVTPGNWNKFEIIIRYNNKNQLKVHW
jgi:sugar-specific transcriptional regulator TrmB